MGNTGAIWGAKRGTMFERGPRGDGGHTSGGASGRASCDGFRYIFGAFWCLSMATLIGGGVWGNFGFCFGVSRALFLGGRCGDRT